MTRCAPATLRDELNRAGASVSLPAQGKARPVQDQREDVGRRRSFGFPWGDEGLYRGQLRRPYAIETAVKRRAGAERLLASHRVTAWRLIKANSKGSATVIALLKKLYHRFAPDHRYLRGYRAALNDLGDAKDLQTRIFSELVAQSQGKRCLQIGIMHGAKYADHWIASDLYDDSPLIDFRYDVHDMKFPSESFDIVVCNAVLEHVPWPQKAVDELHRVLKPNGLVFVDLPWVQPFHEMPKDYWRATPEGLRVWMAKFEEIHCAHYAHEKSALYTSVFYYGRKPGAAGDR